MTTFIKIPVPGTLYFRDAVADFASLPAVDTVGCVRLALDTFLPYYFNGTIWAALGSGFIGSIGDTNSIDLTETTGTLTADARLSGNSASMGFFKNTLTIQSSGSVGLHVETPIADTNTTGVITDTDWDTFNNKEPAITATTAADYYRGNKTFATLNTAALGVITSGSFPASGKLGEVLVATQAATTTGIAAAGNWGAATELTLSAGVWQISGMVIIRDNGANISGEVRAGVSNSSTGVGIDDFNVVKIGYMYSSSNAQSIAIVNTFVSVSISTTYYLNTLFEYTTGTPQHGGKFQAVRIA